MFRKRQITELSPMQRAIVLGVKEPYERNIARQHGFGRGLISALAASLMLWAVLIFLGVHIYIAVRNGVTPFAHVAALIAGGR